MTITIELPWPDNTLSPNAFVHWREKYEAVRVARNYARVLTLQAWSRMRDSVLTVPQLSLSGRVELRYTFHYPDNRKRDSDNLEAALKAYRDGIADALGVDDECFWPVTKDKRENVKGGKVVVEIG